MKNELLIKGNPNIISKMMYFEKSTVVTKHGVASKRLKAQFQNLNVTAIITFLEDLLPQSSTEIISTIASTVTKNFIKYLSGVLQLILTFQKI